MKKLAPLLAALFLAAQPGFSQVARVPLVVPAAGTQSAVAGSAISPVPQGFSYSLPGLTSPDLTVPAALPVMGPAPVPILNPGAFAGVAPAKAVNGSLPSVRPVLKALRSGGHAAAKHGPGGSEEASPESRTAEGRALFDNDAAGEDGTAAGGLPDIVPDWPGKPGDTVRINGTSYVLGEKLGEGTSAWVYKVEGRPLVVKLIYPGLKDIAIFGGEVEALADIARTRVPYSKLVDHSADGTVLIKTLVEGPRLYDVVKKGPLSPRQLDDLVGLTAELIRTGNSADLNLGNLHWDGTRWVLVDAGGFQKTGPWGPLGQILSPTRLKTTRIDAAAFLRALRTRLGPRSAAWRSVVDSARAPHQLEFLAALADSASPKR